MNSVVFSKEFLDLQLSFAEKVSALSGMPLKQALLEYTNLYVRFGLGREFASNNQKWQAYLAGLRGAADAREWTYHFYLEGAEATTAPPVETTVGCFSYAFSSAFSTPSYPAGWCFVVVQPRRVSQAFASTYASSARVVKGRFRSMPLWGQFADYRGQVKESMAVPFLRSRAQHSAIARLDECFHFQVLTVSALAHEFYDFYGI